MGPVLLTVMGPRGIEPLCRVAPALVPCVCMLVSVGCAAAHPTDTSIQTQGTSAGATRHRGSIPLGPMTVSSTGPMAKWQTHSTHVHNGSRDSCACGASGMSGTIDRDSASYD